MDTCESAVVTKRRKVDDENFCEVFEKKWKQLVMTTFEYLVENKKNRSTLKINKYICVLE